MDFYGFYTGNEFEAYRYLGAHKETGGMVFRTFAPAARQVSLIGDFNGWTDTPMEKAYDGNFWECRVKEAKPGMCYKFRIYGKDGVCRDRCDPYGRQMELRPHSASVLPADSGFRFRDEGWMKRRSACLDGPLNIYEIHLGSWRQKPQEDGARTEDPAPRWHTYEELAEILIPYLQKMHYNYIEMMPLAEHPSDQSWGYQITGFFSPTSRYGTPDQLKKLVESCHQAGIGVIMDFVPVHFAPDDYGLWQYDGTSLYEYPSGDVGRSQWGSCNFMHSRGEVRSFLQSCANYWLEEFHFDGLRMDAVSNLIYWQGDPARGENRPAVQFLQHMNQELKRRHPSAMLIAEDSTARRGVTAPVSGEGLGFDYKWDMGWMHDTLSYFQSPVREREGAGGRLTFSMDYFRNERYLLPFSHDENVHGKGTILQKMNGGYEGKFPQARALYLYMYAHPGKKLNFMGGEIGQLREWDETRQQDWEILKYPLHDGFRCFMRQLNQVYGENPALWQWDYRPEGFAWLECRPEQCLFGLKRKSASQSIAAVFNFSDQAREYSFAAAGCGRLRLLLSSDQDIYGGGCHEPEKEIRPSGGRFCLRLAPFSGALYRMEAKAK